MSKYKGFSKKALVAILILVVQTGAVMAHTGPVGEDAEVYAGKNLALGIGVGVVEFDSNIKVTPNDGGRSRFVDLEGTLNLPSYDTVNTIYGTFRFNEKHSLIFGYFAIKRESTLLDISENFEDIILIDANITLRDNSRFYNLAYGYNLFRDDRSDITLVLGLKGLDLRLQVEARGEITVDDRSESAAEIAEADVVAPLPLLGLNFGVSFTPEWSISTQIGLVAGSYQDIKARVLQTSIISRYNIASNAGILLGLTYFDANVDVDDEEFFTEVAYGYKGAFLGLHLGF